MTTIDNNSTVVVSFGSNTKQKGDNVVEAIRWFCSLMKDVRVSHVYETAPVGSGTAPYANAVAIGCTDMCLQSVTMAAKEYELVHGRDVEARRNGEVPIDIDVVMWNGDISRQQDFAADFFQIGYTALTRNQEC